jgi:hypothetical protein
LGTVYNIRGDYLKCLNPTSQKSLRYWKEA